MEKLLILHEVVFILLFVLLGWISFITNGYIFI